MLKTKTFWASIGTIGFGVTLIINGNVETGIQTIAGGVLAIFMRDGIAKNGSSNS